MTIVSIAFAAGGVGLLFALVQAIRIVKLDKGNETVQFIGRAIQEGAMAFLSREYRLLGIFVVVMAVILAVFIDYDVTGRVEDASELFDADRSVPSTAIAEQRTPPTHHTRRLVGARARVLGRGRLEA